MIFLVTGMIVTVWIRMDHQQGGKSWLLCYQLLYLCTGLVTLSFCYTWWTGNVRYRCSDRCSNLASRGI